MLTQKQETFVLNLFKGMTQREAWIQAGYSSNYAPAIIDSNACALANSSKIKARYNELNKKTEGDTVATVVERKQRLTAFMREDIVSDKGIKLRAGNIAATTELNKMDGSYAPEKIDIREILITADMRALAAKEMLEIKEKEDELLDGTEGTSKEGLST